MDEALNWWINILSIKERDELFFNYCHNEKEMSSLEFEQEDILELYNRSLKKNQ